MPMTRQELGRLLHEKLPLGDPDLVVVDRRSLELIMGDLAPLLILGSVDAGAFDAPAFAKRIEMVEEPYVWETDLLCPICEEPLAYHHVCKEG